MVVSASLNKILALKYSSYSAVVTICLSCILLKGTAVRKFELIWHFKATEGEISYIN